MALFNLVGASLIIVLLELKNISRQTGQIITNNSNKTKTDLPRI